MKVSEDGFQTAGNSNNTVPGPPQPLQGAILNKAGKEKTYQVIEKIRGLEPFFPDRDHRITIVPLTQGEYLLQPGVRNNPSLLLTDNTQKVYTDLAIRDLTTKNTTKFLFEYCFPIKRMGFLLMLYSAGYFVDNPKVQNLFGNTKEQLKSTFLNICLLYTSPSPRDVEESRMPSSA